MCTCGSFGNVKYDFCQAFGDLALARLRPIGALGLAPPILHALLGVIQPWVQVLGCSLHRLGTSAPSYPPVVAGVVRLVPSRLGPPTRRLGGVAL